ncbi:MAG: hypothetical protein U5R46_02765 [Gammaproteobacteria bacterium]|nr:hypothetical protein [Gammaproteobacteria bacterium]
MPTCHIHDCELVSAIVPIRYGYPIMDESWDLASENPHHGHYELGGCVITPDSPRTRSAWVCPVCTENVRSGKSSTDNSP